MKKRQRLWQRNLGRRCHGIAFDAGLGVLQRPGQMMNVAPVNLVLVDRVQTIPRSKKILQRSFVADARRSNRSIAANEFGRLVSGRTPSSTPRATRTCLVARSGL